MINPFLFIYLFIYLFCFILVHSTTESCDKNYQIPYLNIGADGLIGTSASIIFLFLMPPVVYTIAKIVVPFG